MPPQASSTDVTLSDVDADAPDRGPEGGETVGVVFGDVDARRFRFAVHEDGLGKGTWVAVDHPERGAVLARVTGVRRETNLTAEEARGLDDPADGPDDEVTAEARVVGSAQGDGAPPSTPVPAGAAVRRAPGRLLANALGLPDPDGPRPRGAYLGKVRGRDVDVVLDVEDLVRRHVSVLAKTGAGKSYLVGVLLEELAKEGVPAVVVDPHAEHTGLAHPNRDEDAFPRMREFGVKPAQYADQLARFHPDPGADPEADPLRLDAANLPRDELEQLVGDLTNAQEGVLHEALRTLRDRPAHYTLEDVAREVRESESSARWSLLSSLETLAERDLFQGESTDPSALVSRGQVSMVNLRGVGPETAEMAVARLANTLFEARKQGEIPPFLLVVEEAHRFCPERGYDTSVAGPALRTVASEGRKFGMGCAIVSQRPAKVDKNVLSQCNTEIALKVTNPRDVKALASSLEGLTDEVADEIQRLPVGQAVVSHPDLRTPAITEVRPRETRPDGDQASVVADDPAEAAGDTPAPDPDAFPADPTPEGEPVPGEDLQATPDVDPGAGDDPEPAAEEDPEPEAGDPPPDAEPEAPDEDEDEPDEEASLMAAPRDPAPPEAEDWEAPEETAPETVLDEAAPEPPEGEPEPDAPDEADPASDDAETEHLEPDPEEAGSPDDAETRDQDPAEPEVDAVLQVDEPDASSEKPCTDEPDAADEIADGDPDEAQDETADEEETPMELDAQAPEPQPEHESGNPDDVLQEAAETPEDPDEADLDEETAADPREPDRTIGAVREAHGVLEDADPDDLPLDRLQRLVDEVEDLLTRLGRVGNRTPDVVEAHNALASELVRFRRALARREANHPVDGVVRR